MDFVSLFLGVILSGFSGVSIAVGLYREGFRRMSRLERDDFPISPQNAAGCEIMEVWLRSDLRKAI